MAWKWNKSVGLLLLAIWLIISGMLYFVHFGSIDMAPLLAGLAIAAGVFILLDR
jgi:hypothetical protein